MADIGAGVVGGWVYGEARVVILAIDDDAGRYDGLRRLLEDRPGAPEVRVVSCPDCVARELPGAVAVLLDYDLDGEDCCPGCGGWRGARKGLEHVPAVVGAGVPVIVTSCSAPENRRALVEAARAGGARVVGHAAEGWGVELAWLGRLWVWGVL